MDKPFLKKTKSGRWKCIWRKDMSIQPTAIEAYSRVTARVVTGLDRYIERLENSLDDYCQKLEDTEHRLALERRDNSNIGSQVQSVDYLKYEMKKLIERRDEWIVERICHYNQEHINYIWKNKQLPVL